MRPPADHQSCIDNAKVGDRVIVSWFPQRGVKIDPFTATVIKNTVEDGMYIANNDDPQTLFGERRNFSNEDIPKHILNQFKYYAYCSSGALKIEKIIKHVSTQSTVPFPEEQKKP